MAREAIIETASLRDTNPVFVRLNYSRKLAPGTGHDPAQYGLQNRRTAHLCYPGKNGAGIRYTIRNPQFGRLTFYP